MSQPTHKPDSLAATLALPLVITVAAIAAYLGALQGAFVFDDFAHIHNNAAIRDLPAIWDVLTGSRRPLVNLTLALNYAISGLDPRGYHVLNIAVHVCCALALYGVVRRTLLPSGSAPTARAAAVAGATALLWAVHPLTTQSVTYVIQRSESMMSLCYLLTLYCVIRGTHSRHRAWYVAAIVACAAGMASKGVMVTAPLLVLLYDRIFLSSSFSETLRRRWWVYLGLAGGWIVLHLCGVTTGVLDPTPEGQSMVGFGFKDITPIEYARTQAGVILHYLRLSVWPIPLCLDYQWPVATWPESALPLAIVGAMVAATLVALRRAPRIGFVAACFFMILGPTSSFVPIRDVAFEHRMYLPLASVVLLIVLSAATAGAALGRRFSLGGATRRAIWAALVIVAAIALAIGTWHRNQDYVSEEAMWRSVLAVRPANARAHESLGMVLVRSGDLTAAEASLQEAVRVAPDEVSARVALGHVMLEQRRVDEAIAMFRAATALERPRGGPFQLGQARFALAETLTKLQRFSEAIPIFEAAIEHFSASPKLSAFTATAHVALAGALRVVGRTRDAMDALDAAVELDASNATAHRDLGDMLWREGRFDEGISHLRTAIELQPADGLSHRELATALTAAGRTTQAIESFREAQRLRPDDLLVAVRLSNIFSAADRLDEAVAELRAGIERAAPGTERRFLASAHFNLGNSLLQQQRLDEAIVAYRGALAIDPSHVNAQYGLGIAHERMGDIETAATSYAAALRIDPDHAGARAASDRLSGGDE